MKATDHFVIAPIGMYPERYQVEAFPSPEQLAAMGNELAER